MHKAWRIARRVLVGALLLLVVSALGLLIALQFRPVRAFARDRVLSAIRGSLKGELYVDDIRWPSLGRIDLSGLELRDRRGVPVAQLPSLAIDVRVRSLFSGRVDIDRLDIDHLAVDLGDLSDQAGLLSVFASDEPPKPPDTSDLSPITIAIRSLCLSEATLEVQPEPERHLSLRHVHTCVALGVGRYLELTLRELRAELQNNRQSLLELVPPERVPALAASTPTPASGTPPPPPSASPPLRTALSGTFRFRTSADMAFDARLAARGFSPQTLAVLGIKSDVLRAPLDTDVHVHAAAQRISYRVQVRAPQSAAELSGELNPQRVLWAHLVSEQITPIAVTTLELETLAFELDARIDLSTPDKLSAQLNLVRGKYGELALPETALQAERSKDGALLLRSFEARYGAGLLSGSGRRQADGSAEVDAKLVVEQLADIPPVQRYVPGLRGGLSTHVNLAVNAASKIAARAELELKRFEFQNHRAEHVTLSAHVRGAARQPELDAKLVGSTLVIAGEQAQQAELQITGGPQRYRVSARVDDKRLVLDSWAEAKRGAWEGSLQLSSELAQTPVTLQVPSLRFVPNTSLELHELRAHVLDAALFADGVLGLNENVTSRLRFAASVPNLAQLTTKFGASEVPGRVELSGSARGRMAQPVVEVNLAYVDGAKLGRHASQVEVQARADLEHAQAQVTLEASAGQMRAKAKLASHWQRRAPLAAALAAAQHELDVDLQGLSIAELLAPKDPDLRAPVAGLVSGHLNARGNQTKFRLETQFASRMRAVRDPTSVDLLFTGTYADAQLHAQLKVGDRRGQLLNFELAHDFDAEHYLAHPLPGIDVVTKTHWQANAEFAKRQLRELPVLSGLGVDTQFEPLSVATTLHVDHTPDAEPTAELQTTLSWEPSPPQWPDSAPCSQRTHATFQLSGQLANSKLTLLMEGGPEAQRAIHLETSMHVNMAELLAGKFAGLGPLKLDVLISDLDLARLPIVCERGSGVVSASVAGRDLFNKLADIKLKAEAQHLRWDLSPPLEVAANAQAEGEALLVDARLLSGQGAMRVNGRLPIGFRVADPALCVNRAGEVGIKTTFQRVDVASLLAYVPGVARESGRVDGAIDVTGTLQKPIAQGSLRLDDVSFTLPRLGQRFSHLQLKANLDGRSLRLQDGKVRDLDGSASLAALLTLDDATAWTAELNLNARNFPLRKSGVIMGRADADAKLVARTTPDKTDVSVTLKNVSVQLTSGDFGQVQSLDPHPEIVFSDAAPAEKESPKLTATSQPSTPTTIHIVTSEPLWVRRDDFAVQMQTDLHVVLGRAAPELTGKIDLRRGFISLLGQSFDIKRGQVLLTGGSSIDPQLEITAVHSTPGGTVVRLEVTGFVHAPELAFFVNDQAVTAGDAVTAMTGHGDPGGSASKDTQQQIASAAVGMTTGLLSLGARREFGDWIPMLAIDPGEQTRVRVGVEADRLIPSFLHGFVRGAYVEGIVATGDNSSSAGQASANGGANSSASANTASGSGVLLELLLPSDFVWAGQYGPGESWSVDMDWRP